MKNSKAIGAIAILPNNEKILLKYPNWVTESGATSRLVLETLLHLINTPGKFIIYFYSPDFTKSIFNSNLINTSLIHTILTTLEQSHNKFILCQSKIPQATENIMMKSAISATQLQFSKATNLFKEEIKTIVNQNII